MGLAGQNQVRQFYPALNAPGHTTVAAVSAGTIGDIAILSADGSDVAANTDFKLFKKNAAGNVVSSDLVKVANVQYAKAISYQAPVLGSVSFSGLAVPTVGELNTVEIVIKGFGSYSPEDEYVKKAFYKTVTGNTAESVVDGLIASLNRNFSREVGATASSNPYFSFTKGSTAQTVTVGTAPTVSADASVTVNGTAYTVALLSTDTDILAAGKIAAVLNGITGVTSANGGTAVATTTSTFPITITYDPLTTGSVAAVAITAASAGLIIKEKDQSQFYVVGKKERTNIDFTADMKATTLPTVTKIASDPGIGSGKSIASMEWYLKGERNDFYREMGYPHNFENSYEVSATGTYDVVEIAYFDEGRDEAKKSKKQITVAFPVSARTNANLFVDDLETATGLTIAALA
tara:strand:+ start:41969 stop:43183 length:1215 start_codon:yes stop_codon:yes gene_type:complete